MAPFLASNRAKLADKEKTLAFEGQKRLPYVGVRQAEQSESGRARRTFAGVSAARLYRLIGKLNTF